MSETSAKKRKRGEALSSFFSQPGMRNRENLSERIKFNLSFIYVVLCAPVKFLDEFDLELSW